MLTYVQFIRGNQYKNIYKYEACPTSKNTSRVGR